MEKVLLVEDLAETQMIVKTTLGGEFALSLATSIAEAREILARESIDLVILDATLPDGDGFKLCAELRNAPATSPIPVVLLTARGSLSDKVAAFSYGADDYVTKPFEPLELKARIVAQMKRLRERNRAQTVIQRGALRLSTEEYKAYGTDQGREAELKLTPMEFRLLHFLIKNEHRVVTRADILSGVWGQGVFVVDRVIDKHVSSLRQKLGSLADYIQTVPRLGYQFVGAGGAEARVAVSADSEHPEA